MSAFTDFIVEDADLAWLEGLGYAVLHGPDKSSTADTFTLARSQWERGGYSAVVLEEAVR